MIFTSFRWDVLRMDHNLTLRVSDATWRGLLSGWREMKYASPRRHESVFLHLRRTHVAHMVMGQPADT